MMTLMEPLKIPILVITTTMYFTQKCTDSKTRILRSFFSLFLKRTKSTKSLAKKSWVVFLKFSNEAITMIEHEVNLQVFHKHWGHPFQVLQNIHLFYSTWKMKETSIKMTKMRKRNSGNRIQQKIFKLFSNMSQQ